MNEDIGEEVVGEGDAAPDATRLASRPAPTEAEDDLTRFAAPRDDDMTRLAARDDDKTRLADSDRTRLVERGVEAAEPSLGADEATRLAPPQPSPPPPADVSAVGDETVRWEDPSLGSAIIVTGGSAYDPGVEGIVEATYGVGGDQADIHRLNPNLGIYAPLPLHPSEVASISAQDKKYLAGTRRLQVAFTVGMGAVGVGAIAGLWALFSSL